jgi:hypothetical protein
MSGTGFPDKISSREESTTPVSTSIRVHSTAAGKPHPPGWVVAVVAVVVVGVVRTAAKVDG